MQPPSDAALAAIMGPTTHWVRWVDIYEADNETLWASHVPVHEGAVSVDETRTNGRRNLDTSIHRHATTPHESNLKPELFNHPLNLWYDKIVKPSRGVLLPDGSIESWQLGEFMIDEIDEPRFPQTISLKCRDLSKMGMLSKFELATTFGAGQDLDVVISDIASNAGFTKKLIPDTGKQLGTDFTFEKGTERWKAMEDLAQAYGWEIYINAEGYFVLREIRDPSTAAVSWRFETGGVLGNLSDYATRSNDSRIYNHTFVTGKAADDSLVWGEAKNLNANSYTRIRTPDDPLPGGLSDRLFQFHSDFINTFEQCQENAEKFLAIHALESWELDLEAFVLPWLEAGEIIEFRDPSPDPGELEITRWRLSNFSIPLALATMGLNTKRIQLVVP